MLKRLTALLIVFTITSYSFAAGINSLFGTFDRVIDGDTLVFKTASAKTLRIRLADIDTPELDQPWGEEAKAALSGWVQGELGRIDIVDTDRYGRPVATVWIDDENINRRLVKEGHAWVYRKYLRDRTLLSLETNARAQKLGLWLSDNVVTPEAWRGESRRRTAIQK